MVGRFQRNKRWKTICIRRRYARCSKPKYFILRAGAGFVSKTTHYQLKSREQAKRDSFDILTKKFRRTYGKMKEMPSNVPVALKGTTNQSLHVSYQQGMCKISFQELNNEVL